MKRVLQFFTIFLISLPFNSCDFFSDSVEKDFSEAAKKYSENYREAVFNEDKTEFFALVKNVEAFFLSMLSACFICVDKQPKHKHLSKHKETVGKHDEKNSAQEKRGSLFSAGFPAVFLH